MQPLKILFVAAEMAPLVKVGGLADVLGALPAALAARGHDVRVLLPAYGPEMLGKAKPLKVTGRGRVKILERREAQLPCPVWLLNTPAFMRRKGRPYLNRTGRDWAGNAEQFARLSRVAADIASGSLVPGWQPDVVHCNDWHTGLTPVWMVLEGSPAASVFTIHNLGYPGCFSPDVLDRVGLPAHLNHPEALEFYGDIAFIKGGLKFADRLTTVSPRYAAEILTPTFGCGMEGVLNARIDRLSGILNGIDLDIWSPESDALLTHQFDREHLEGKQAERDRLLETFSLDPVSDVEGAREPVVAWIGRLADQKGADLLVEALPQMMESGMRLVVLGSGNRELEVALTRAAARWKGRLGVRIGFDEPLAHNVYAGADMLLMPSRFEPCGLAQMCAMRYGTIPLVTAVGGLADTVVDVDTRQSGEAPQRGTGFHLAAPTAPALLEALKRATSVFDHPAHWRALVHNAMMQRFDWNDSATAYEQVYAAAMADSAARRSVT